MTTSFSSRLSRVCPRVPCVSISSGNGNRGYRRRRSRGAALVLVLAVFGFLALGLLFFCLKYIGFLGSYHEQRSAIEAAALTAAKDISAIVIEDPNFGFIGLSDSSPICTNTTAGDNYYTSVTGINTLFGTIRLDMIIADYLQDPIMASMAQTDYKNALTTQQNLVSALQTAGNGGTGTDANGNTINPLQDATNTYNSNPIHLVAGQSCTLVPGSMKLSIGYVDGLSTRTQIPKPQNVGSVTIDQQTNGFYIANADIPYKTTDFVFAAQGANATLVDYRIFQTTLNSLPFSTPSVIKVDADEQYTESAAINRKIHATAAALSGTVTDQRPNPGAFTITFVDGPVPEIQQAGDIINNLQVQADPTDLFQTPPNGDYPQTTMVDYSMQFLPDSDKFHPRFENIFSVAMYDWIRRGGTNIDVSSLLTALQTPMDFGKGGPQIQMFHLTSSGKVTNDSKPWGQVDLGVSNKQYRAISGLGIYSSNQNTYDLQITDFCRIEGRTKGGLHAGEPLPISGTTGMNPAAATFTFPTLLEMITWPYEEFPLGPGSGAKRQTYYTEGIAIDFTLRKRNAP